MLISTLPIELSRLSEKQSASHPIVFIFERQQVTSMARMFNVTLPEGQTSQTDLATGSHKARVMATLGDY